jgi:AraC family transcriptional regulator
MINLQDKNYTPTLDESDAYIQNPIFLPFCSEIKTAYQCSENIEYSSCS